MAKIFFTIPYFLPANPAGEPVQFLANLTREITENVAYFIICPDVDFNGAELENIQRNQWVKFNDYTQVWYAGPEKISDAIVRQVESLKPDLLFIVGLFSWHFNMVPLIFCKGPRKIISTGGQLHPVTGNDRKWRKRVLLKIFKLFEYQYKVEFHSIDTDESNIIAAYFKNVSKVWVAPDFPDRMAAMPFPSKMQGVLKLLTIGPIRRTSYILEIIHALKTCGLEIEYAIYCANGRDEDYLQMCKKAIKELPANIKVNYYYTLSGPEVNEALAKAHIFIMQQEKGTFGHCLYEALSASRPVITDNFSSFNHLEESNAGLNIQMNQINEINKAVHFFGEMDEAEFEKWSHGARLYAEKAIDIEAVKIQYREMFHLENTSPGTQKMTIA